MSEHYNSKKRAREADSEHHLSNPASPFQDLVVTLFNLGNANAKISFQEELKLCCDDIKALWPSNKDSLIEVFMECLMGLPHKTSKYCLLLAMLNEYDRDCAGSIMSRLSNFLVMEDKPWWMMGQLLRCFGELATLRLVSVADLCTLIEMYLKNGNENALLSLYYGLPFSFKLLSVDAPDFLKSVCQALADNLKNIELKANEYSLQFDPSASFSTLLVGFEQCPLLKLSPITDTQSYISLSFPSQLQFSSSSSFSLPVNVLSEVFIGDRLNGSWEECCLYRHVDHIFECTNYNPRKCCELLFNANPDDLEANADKIVAQYLFGALHRLDKKTAAKFMLITACRYSKPFPSAMAKCVFALVDRMKDPASCDLVFLRNLASWFALHLSTFDFKWPWEYWKDFVVGREESAFDVDGRFMFLNWSFEYLGRLSYNEKLVSSVPSYLHQFIPGIPKPIPSIVESNASVAEMITSIKSKKPSSEISFNNPDDRVKFFEAVLLVGSKSLSHVTVLLDRYKELFVACGNDEQLALLTVASNLWRNSAHNFELVSGLLLESSIVSAEALTEWSLSSLENALNESSVSLFTAWKRFVIVPSATQISPVAYAQKLNALVPMVIADKHVVEFVKNLSRSIFHHYEFGLQRQ